MTLTHFTYSNTFDFSQNFLDKFQDSNIRVSNETQCASVSYSNKSNMFILTDFNSATADASCLFLNTINYSESSYNDWVSGLVPCSDKETCYETSGNITFGLQGKSSLYISPLIELMSSQTAIPKVDTGRFNILYQTAMSDLDTFKTYRKSYLEQYYLHVNEDGTFPVNIKDNISNLEEEMNKSQMILQNDLALINQEFNALLESIGNFNQHLKEKSLFLDIINQKILLTNNFFNVLMNKNQGAIGELDINSYNLSLSIFKNLIISIAIIIGIYIYLKKGD